MAEISAHSWPWDVLGIAPNADERAVRRAYARLLKQQRPDDDVEAFQRLRYAYESALQLASGGAKSAPAPHVDEAELAVPERNPFETAIQLWQDFVAQPEHVASRRSLQELFASVVNIPTREELEWQALCHCMNEDAPAGLRINLSAVLGWRENAGHLRRRNAAVASVALDRVFADEDYDSLRCRFPNAMALLEGPQPRAAAGARTLLRADMRSEMEQLLTALGRYHANVVRLRLDIGKLEFWTQCLTLRVGFGRLFGPASALSLWCGLLFASATVVADNGSWTATQLFIVLATVMLTMAGGCVFILALSETQQSRLQALRANRWLRDGWIPLWLAATAAAMACDDSRASAVALGTLGLCTFWAALVHNWPRVKQLALLAAITAVGFGFAGHRLESESRAWLLPYAHGVLFAFFLAFAQENGRAWLAHRPRFRWAGVSVWFAGFAALLVLLLQQDPRTTPFAWAIFSAMPVLGSVLGVTRWNDVRRAVPPFFRGYLHLLWVALALVKPGIVACICAGLMSVWIIEGLKEQKARR
ncbi:hypothetical protein P3T18_005975 [Paraburkholderia sp. GAS199]|uniref:J domain-containing protein n=1 Tax=Paraburkholderia sp. GAS199 TaxID=3035126 RepID=UPI003D1C1265